MWCLAGGVELFDVMPVDRLHHANPGEFHRTATAASVTMWAAVCTCFILCWAFRDLLRQPGDSILERPQLFAVR
jgi:hypothetical protein